MSIEDQAAEQVLVRRTFHLDDQEVGGVDLKWKVGE